MAIQTCSCGATFTIGMICNGKVKVYRDAKGDAVDRCPKCGKELR